MVGTQEWGPTHQPPTHQPTIHHLTTTVAEQQQAESYFPTPAATVVLQSSYCLHRWLERVPWGSVLWSSTWCLSPRPSIPHKLVTKENRIHQHHDWGREESCWGRGRPHRSPDQREDLHRDRSHDLDPLLFHERDLCRSEDPAIDCPVHRISSWSCLHRLCSRGLRCEEDDPIQISQYESIFCGKSPIVCLRLRLLTMWCSSWI